MQTALTTTALTAMLAGAPALAQNYDLRGPTANDQNTLVTTVESNAQQGRMTMDVQGQEIAGTMSVSATHIQETTVLEMHGEHPTRVRTEVVHSVTNNRMNINGQVQNQQDRSGEGLVLMQTMTEEGWQTEVTAGDFPPEAQEMIRTASYIDPCTMYPEQPVAVGHSWTIEGDEIQAFMGGMAGIPGATFAGEITFEFEEVVQVDGQDVAVLSYEMDCDIIMDMDLPENTGMRISMEMEGVGNVFRNLASYAAESDFEGEMVMDMTVTVGRETMMDMTASMPIEVATSQENRPVDAEPDAAAD